jgi:acyl-CoA thioesterase-2
MTTDLTTAHALHEHLLTALTLSPTDSGTLRAPYFTEGRGIVFGGQLLGQTIVAAARQMTSKRVKSVQTVFARGVRMTDPVDILVEPMHEGRNIGSVTVSFVQNEQICVRALVLLDAAEPDLVRYQIPMPETDPPDETQARPHPLTAPQTIVVGDVDVRDPAAIGPATLQLWMRFPEAPNPADGNHAGALHRALISHATDGWLIGVAMRPHPNLGQGMAHSEVSTGVLTQSMSFHGEPDAREWLLIDHEVLFSGGGRTSGRGHVFTRDGELVASFTQEALLRAFPKGQDVTGKQATVF